MSFAGSGANRPTNASKALIPVAIASLGAGACIGAALASYYRRSQEAATPTPSITRAAPSSPAQQDEPDIVVSSITIYPIKSCAGVSCSSARITERGLENDRMFMVTDFIGRMQTQRQNPRLACIRATFAENGDLVISASGRRDIVVSASQFHSGEEVKVSVFSSECRAIDQGDEVADFLSGALETPGLRLRRMHPEEKRAIESGYTTQTDGVVSFADGYPILLAAEASFDSVRKQCTDLPGLSLARFRPNIVVRGDGMQAFDEDQWTEIAIADSRLELPKMCSRCKVPRVEQATGVAHSTEPTATLTEMRSFGGKRVYFGRNAVPISPGSVIRVGDRVSVARERAETGPETRREPTKATSNGSA